MKTTPSIMRRMLLSLGGLALAIALLAPASAMAQNDIAKCRCDHFTVRIGKVNCKVTICYAVSPSGKIICETFGPGDEFKLPCFPGQQIGLRLCNGSVVPIDNPAARCITGTLAPNCCVRSCASLDAAGCIMIDITGIQCAVDDCP